MPSMKPPVAICVLSALLLGACASLPEPRPDAAQALKDLARGYVEAQFAFDQAALQRLTAPQFVEVSPKGEVDERAAVIGFYAPDRKTASPPCQVLEQQVRLSGSTAVVTQILEMGSAPRVVRMTQALSATWTQGQWLLTSSQTTPVPPPRKP